VAARASLSHGIQSLRPVEISDLNRAAYRS
jgi:hypothetical protein